MLLDGGRLVFRGVADVAFEAGYQAPVGVWQITPDNERALMLNGRATPSVIVGADGKIGDRSP